MYLGSWWEPLRPWWGSIALAIANPPYIPDYLVEHLEPIVRDHEPHIALCGGTDGMDACKEVVLGATKALDRDGLLILEHHHDQSEKLLEFITESGFQDVDYGKDLEGKRRFAIARLP